MLSFGRRISLGALREFSVVSKNAMTVQTFITSRGYDFKVKELAASTRTAAEAATTIGCNIDQIVKSIVFKTTKTNTPILVLASGKNHIDENRLALELGEDIIRPDGKYVKTVTGYPIGGVPPIAHKQPIRTLIDADLLALDEVWAAAGTPNSVFKLLAKDLPQLTSGQVISLTTSPVKGLRKTI
jgi:prolyl-tRNA editing enzyme YbaK/EbsC (Cys-tRNA(Pro) deacylase)